MGFPGSSAVKIGLQWRRSQFDPGVGKVPWRRGWQPTPIFLAEEFQGQRSLVGCSPQGRKGLDMTEQHSLSYIKYITNKDLLYSTRNYTQYLVMAHKGKEYENIYTYTYIYVCVCITESLYVHQKAAQHCKSTILQFLKLKLREVKRSGQCHPPR